MTTLLRTISFLFLLQVASAQNFRTDAQLQDSDITLMNMNMERANGSQGFQVVSTDYQPQNGIGDIVVSKFDDSGTPLSTYKVYGDGMEFMAMSTCLSFNSGNIIIVGTVQLVDQAYQPHAFFLEYDESANSILSFNLFKDPLETMALTFLNVQQGYLQEYVVVGYIQAIGNPLMISLISGFDIGGNLLWERQYTGPGGGFINAFESVDKANYVINGPSEGGGGLSVPYGSSYLISGVGDNALGEFLTCVALFDYNNKSFWWYKTVKTTYFHIEKGTQVIYDQSTDKVLLFSQHSGAHNFQVYRFDTYGNYVDHHTYYPNNISYPGMILSSVIEKNGDYWLNGYFSCPWGGTQCPNGVITGSPFSIIVDKNLNLKKSIVFDIHNTGSSGNTSFIFNGPPEFAVGFYFLGSDTWTPESQYVMDEKIFFPFGEQSLNGESIDLVSIEDLNQLGGVCADTFWVVENSTTSTPYTLDPNYYSWQICTISPYSGPDALIEEIFTDQASCDDDLRRGTFPNDLISKGALVEVEVFDETGKSLGKYGGYEEMRQQNFQGFLIIRESYSDGSIESNKLFIRE